MPKKQKADATCAAVLKNEKAALLPSAGFYDGKIAPSKEEPTPPLPVAHPSRESGIFSLCRAGLK